MHMTIAFISNERIALNVVKVIVFDRQLTPDYRIPVKAQIGSFQSLSRRSHVCPLADKINSLRSVSWNPLGTLIATGSADKTLRV
jgi:WD40 repeat protein